ncbi:hypothetical protein RJ640_006264 [Escallonia rubra]|uniref:Uncharacterized protein n=1 Tax=Escallonia rubra TaxID=112253 RepID=A0AA88UQC9_9ASTE|nr:hypothetical protein RJ640_006264 [Escallonia rubra]
MPQRKPSPPERDTMAGRELAYGDVNKDDLLLFFCQHMTSCLPSASMAQKKPLSPNAAAIGPDEPYPKVAIAIADSSKRKGRKCTQEKTMCYGYFSKKTHNSKHGPSAVNQLRLLESLEIRRYFTKAKWVKSKISAIVRNNT